MSMRAGRAALVRFLRFSTLEITNPYASFIQVSRFLHDSPRGSFDLHLCRLRFDESCGRSDNPMVPPYSLLLIILTEHGVLTGPLS